jgi:nitrogen-specific signal transduction histidine kinase
MNEGRSLESGGSGLGIAIVRTIDTGAGRLVRLGERCDTTRFVTNLPIAD